MTARARPRDVVTTPARRAAYEAKGLWDRATLVSSVREHARRSPERVAVVDLAGRRRSSYADLDRDSDAVAQALLGAGVQPREVVAVQLPNWYETVAVDVGVMKAGAVLEPLLTAYRENELEHMLRLTEARVIVTPSVYRGFDHRALVAKLRVTLPDLDHICIEDPDASGGSFGLAASGSSTAPLPVPDAADVSEIIFSSGTEAQPKAIMHTEQTTNFSARTVWSTLEMGAQEVVYAPSPIGHSTGLNYGARVALLHGVAVVLQDRWDPALAARLIAAERCTYTLAATTFLKDLIEQIDRVGGDLSSLRAFNSSGAPIPPELVARAEDLGVRVLRLYGSTEMLAVTWNRPDAPLEKRITTDGDPLPDTEVEVRGDDGRRGLVGEPGEIFARGPGCAVGFYRDPERTATTFDDDGWVRSGDVGVLDADGYLRIVGRKKEIIIRGGLKVPPREIEEQIATMPAVAAVSVVGLPHERLGEIGCACIVLRPGHSLELADVVAHLRGLGLAAYKLPERLEIVDSLPVTSTGKVQKHVLVERLGRSDGG